jgi:hypothetical protein
MTINMPRTVKPVSAVAAAALAAGFASLALAGPAWANEVDQTILVSQCTHNNGNPEHCDQSPGVAIETSGPGLIIEFTARPEHCSDIDVQFAVNNMGTGGLYRLGPGQTARVESNAPAGHHYVRVEATGIRGGCNNGTLESWGGHLRVEQAPVKIDNG